MKNGLRKYILLIVGFVMLVLIEYFKPKPVDWSLSFENDEKIPYGCYALSSSLEELFSNQEITVSKTSYFQYLSTRDSDDEAIIIITDNFDADQYDTGALLDFVRKGNQLFICSADYSQSFSDSCDFTVSTNIIDTLGITMRHKKLNFVNPKMYSDTGYDFTGQLYHRRFTTFDTISTVVLGYSFTSQTNFIKIVMGEGEIFINLQPLAFTNYNVLYGTEAYSACALSYLNAGTLIWDEYYKPDRALSSSPIRFILNQQSLTYAYYLVLVLLLLYIAIEAKRTQRVIPVVKLPDNATLSFVKTIGILYYQRGDHKDLAMKKIAFLKEHVLHRYYLNISEPTESIIHKWIQRSGVPEEDIYKLADSMNKIKSKNNITEQELTAFNKQVETYYEQSI